jgi:hypothetical protein
MPPPRHGEAISRCDGAKSGQRRGKSLEICLHRTAAKVFPVATKANPAARKPNLSRFAFTPSRKIQIQPRRTPIAPRKAQIRPRASLYGGNPARGTAIKVSDDGPITVYRHGRLVSTIG